MAPANVSKYNQVQVYIKLYGGKRNTKIQFKFKVGDHVRISRAKHVFEKGYVPNWTEEVFIVDKRIRKLPPIYKVKDLNGEEVQSVFYEQELQKVRVDSSKEYRIDKIVQVKGKG
jgi:hypothetical protein